MRHLILLLAVGLALSANAETTELACRTENGGEFHLLINFDANTVTRTWMYGNEAHKETRDANITESQVNWQYYDSDDVEVTNTLSRDTGNMYTSTRPTTKTPRGILAGGTHSVCNKAAKAFGRHSDLDEAARPAQFVTTKRRSVPAAECSAL